MARQVNLEDEAYLLLLKAKEIVKERVTKEKEKQVGISMNEPEVTFSDVIYFLAKVAQLKLDEKDKERLTQTDI